MKQKGWFFFFTNMFDFKNGLNVIYILTGYSVYCYTMFDVEIQWNTKLRMTKSSIITTFQGVSIKRCLRACEDRPACTVVGYRRLASVCSLHASPTLRVTANSPGHLVAFGSNQQGICGNVTCKSNQVCDERTSTCLITECGYPDIEMQTRGNRYEIGSKIAYTSAGGDVEQMICAANGHWDYKRKTAFNGLTCRDVQRDANLQAKSGVYTNRLNITIFCDFEIDGGGWLVFQRRQDGSVDFYRGWEDYKKGFGDMFGEFWLGLENLYVILQSSTSSFELRVDLGDWKGNKRFAKYDAFFIDGEHEDYRLQTGLFSGNAGDSFNGSKITHNGQKFSTMDKDNDNWHNNCAKVYIGAWWYNACHSSNLNGHYYHEGETAPRASGIVWEPWKGYRYWLRSTTMMIREK